MVFFLVYLVFPRTAKVLSIWLVTYCEVHFAVLYLFRLAWFQGLRTDEWRPILDVIGEQHSYSRVDRRSSQRRSLSPLLQDVEGRLPLEHASSACVERSAGPGV